ncbi:MAG: OmpH family outer membrane protein [Acidobacteriota bacterium]
MKNVFQAVALCGIFTAGAIAQTPAPPPRTSPPASNTAAATGGTGAEGKVAIIFFGAFREGIQEMKAKLDALNSEFEPKNKELQALRDRVQNLNNQIQTQGSTVQPAVRAQWAEEAGDKEKLLKRQVEDAEALAKKRFEEVGNPVQEKILRFLDTYAQGKGIVMVFEGGALQQGGLVLFASAATNITDDFIKDYNRANPVAGAAAPATTKK